MGVAITFILPDNPPVKYGLVSSFIIGGTTFTAFLLFLPKLRRLRSLNVQVDVTPTEAGVSKITVTAFSQRSAAVLAIELKICKDRLRECETKLEAKNILIAELEARVPGAPPDREEEWVP
ncbi:PREDICTED: uncharacterized protein LOC106817071 [Priapulus caudatus]|uniref:Uncharacterized protein LOC106817071 n=1 Tax=Priapulus caudatus TaxID=37621 RepID=A0ABM1EYD2_PRICU|nr:PREDICTED: uncharacterized protein LOC106817071 [Priapulus caudatus]